MANIFKKIKNNKAAKFILAALFLYTFWYFIYEFLISKYSKVDYYLDYYISTIASKFLNTIGYPSHSGYYDNMGWVYIDGGHIIGIGDPCNGLSLIAIYSIFIVAFPIKISSKIFPLLYGSFFILLFNLIRVIILVLINHYYPQWLEFNHDYTFNLFMYLIIFLMWINWINRNKTNGENIYS